MKKTVRAQCVCHRVSILRLDRSRGDRVLGSKNQRLFALRERARAPAATIKVLVDWNGL